MDTGSKNTADHGYPVIRPERADGADSGAIHALTMMAFRDAEHSSGTETAIIDALRGAGALTVSLVAVRAGRVIGHIAASPVVLNPPEVGAWYGLGPLSVHPEFQRQGIGSALIRAVIDSIGGTGADGVVLLGEPDFYSRFGFAACDGLTMAGLPPENAPYFQALRLGTSAGEGRDAGYPQATVTYHPAFDATV